MPLKNGLWTMRPLDDTVMKTNFRFVYLKYPLSFQLILFRFVNRQYSYSPTALGREPSEHEYEANAGNFARNNKETYGKLRLSCR